LRRSGMGPVAQPVFKIGEAWQPHAGSVRLRRRSVSQKTKKRSNAAPCPSVVPVAFVGNIVTLRVINLDEPAKPARQA